MKSRCQFLCGRVVRACPCGRPAVPKDSSATVESAFRLPPWVITGCTFAAKRFIDDPAYGRRAVSTPRSATGTETDAT